MDEIKRLKLMIDNGDNIIENYKKIESLISIEYAKIKSIRDEISKFESNKKEASIKEIDENVRNFLNLRKLENNTLDKYFDLLNGIDYLIEKNDREEVKIKKLLYKSKKLKIQKI